MSEESLEATKESLKLIYLDVFPMDAQDPLEVNTLWVLSTGRCGTLTLSQVLSLGPTLTMMHEPMPRLLEHHNKAFYDPDDEFLEPLVRASRIDVISTFYGMGYWYGEASHRFTPYAPYVKRIFPKAKFIYLRRGMDEFTGSALQWNWYDVEPDKFTHTRLPAPDPGDEGQALAWSWCMTNEFIHEFLKTIPRDDWMYLDFGNIRSWNLMPFLRALKWKWGIEVPDKAKVNQHLMYEYNNGRRQVMEKTWGKYDEWAQKIEEEANDLIG